MPRYFFDTHDRSFVRDDEGQECDDFEAARVLAMHTLPEIARFAIPSDGDNQAFTVLIRDESSVIVCTFCVSGAPL